MTFREKLKQEHPEKVDVKYCGGCKYCPETYGYEPDRYCGMADEEKCRVCWDREIPNLENSASQNIDQGPIWKKILLKKV